MEKLNRGDKIFLDKEKTEESLVNSYLSQRDATVEVYEYTDSEGYGNPSRLFLCRDFKHETVAIIKQHKIFGEWTEKYMALDTSELEMLRALINGTNQETKMHGKYSLVRDF